jgi:hypothetical protein
MTHKINLVKHPFGWNRAWQQGSGLLLVFLIIMGTGSVAQEPGKKQTIDITSSFKPVLRNAAKIQFNASPPKPDTGRPSLTYQVPVQNLVPGLAPVNLSPLALKIDSTEPWPNSNYIKAGFGNLSTPYAEAGLSLGNQKAKFVVLASHISSNGGIEYQDYARTAVDGYLFMPLSENLEFNGKVGFRQDKYFQYGFDRSKYNFSKSDLLRRYNTLSARAGVRNLTLTEFGLSYQPQLQVDFFADNLSNNESNIVLNVPIEKYLGKSLSIGLGFNADLTRFDPSGARALNNSIYQVPVAVKFRTPNLRFQAAASPSWDNGKFHLLPNFWAEFPIAREKWVIQAGWISYYEKGNYQRFSRINPYLSVPTDLKNTRMIERYVGFKGVLFQIFTYNAKIGSAQFNSVPLFVNDTASGKSFPIVFEDKLDAMQIQAEMGFTKGEKFSLQAGFNWYSFNKQRTEDRAWGLVPLELKAHFRWMILKDLWLKSDLFMWEGPLYKTSSGGSDRLPGAFDLNAGLEFRVMKNLVLWTQFNNITNSKYQRWHQYDAYGFNMLGGVTLTFDH